MSDDVEFGEGRGVEVAQAYAEMAGKLRAARRLNAVAATVADGYGHLIDSLAPTAKEEGQMPISMTLDMLRGVVAALGGETDPDRLRLHREFNATHRATLEHLLTARLEER